MFVNLGEGIFKKTKTMLTDLCTYDTTRLDCCLRVFIDGNFGVMFCILKSCKSKKNNDKNLLAILKTLSLIPQFNI